MRWNRVFCVQYGILASQRAYRHPRSGILVNSANNKANNGSVGDAKLAMKGLALIGALCVVRTCLSRVSFSLMAAVDGPLSALAGLGDRFAESIFCEYFHEAAIANKLRATLCIDSSARVYAYTYTHCSKSIIHQMCLLSLSYRQRRLSFFFLFSGRACNQY